MIPGNSLRKNKGSRWVPVSIGETDSGTSIWTLLACISLVATSELNHTQCGDRPCQGEMNTGKVPWPSTTHISSA